MESGLVLDDVLSADAGSLSGRNTASAHRTNRSSLAGSGGRGLAGGVPGQLTASPFYVGQMDSQAAETPVETVSCKKTEPVERFDRLG